MTLTTRNRGHLQVVDAETLAAAESGAVDRAHEYALQLLTGQDRTRADLGRALGRRGVDGDVVETVLDRLEAVGLLDDAAFAARYVAQRRGGKGTLGLATELQRRGVASETAHSASSVGGPDADRTAAMKVAQQRLSRLRGLAPDAAQRRLAGVLARRGFPSGLVWSVVREVLGEGSEGALAADEFVDGGSEDSGPNGV